MLQPCAHCGITYEAKTIRSQYCRDVCRALASKARRQAGGLPPAPVRRVAPKRPKVEHQCEQCGTTFWSRANARFCSSQCRDGWHYANTRHTRPCRICGKPMHLTTTSAASENAHRACRAVAGDPLCPDCDGPKGRYSERCRRCAGRRRRVRSDDDRRVTRRQREAAAPGLTARQRSALLAMWLRQRRRCTYCDRPAATVDHVVPLVRGGTNFEGNLVPACRACNSGKRHRLVIELRAKGVRHDQVVRPLRQRLRGDVGPSEVLRLHLSSA